MYSPRWAARARENRYLSLRYSAVDNESVIFEGYLEPDSRAVAPKINFPGKQTSFTRVTFFADSFHADNRFRAFHSAYIRARYVTSFVE